MQVMLPERESCTTYSIRGERPLDDDEFYEFCMENPDLRVEREANGDIIIMPPAGFETEHRNLEICRQLANWALADGRGIASGSNTVFLLASGAGRGPDAAWVLNSRLAILSKKQKKRFISLCPDFVVELTSP